MGNVKGGEASEEAELGGYGAGEGVGVEVDDVEVGAKGELGRDLAGEGVGGEVEDGEIDEVLEVLGDGAGEGIGGEVEGLEGGAVGEEGGDAAGKGEVWKGELVDAAVVADGTGEVGGESVAGGGEGGGGPVVEGVGGIGDRGVEVAQAGLIVGVLDRWLGLEEDDDEGEEKIGGFCCWHWGILGFDNSGRGFNFWSKAVGLEIANTHRGILVILGMMEEWSSAACFSLSAEIDCF